MIKDSSSLTKKSLAEGLLLMISLSEKLCDAVNDSGKPVDNNHSNDITKALVEMQEKSDARFQSLQD